MYACNKMIVSHQWLNVNCCALVTLSQQATTPRIKRSWKVPVYPMTCGQPDTVPSAMVREGTTQQDLFMPPVSAQRLCDNALYTSTCLDSVRMTEVPTFLRHHSPHKVGLPQRKFMQERRNGFD